MKAPPRPLALARSSSLGSPNNLLTNTESNARLRTQLIVNACVLASTSIAVSPHSSMSREPSSSLHRCTSTATACSSPKSTQTKWWWQQAVLRRPNKARQHECSKYTPPVGYIVHRKHSRKMPNRILRRSNVPDVRRTSSRLRHIRCRATARTLGRARARAKRTYCVSRPPAISIWIDFDQRDISNHCI